MLGFQHYKAYNMLALMLDPHYKRLGVVIQYVSKNRVLQIVGEYDKLVLLPLLVCAYKFFNLVDASERVHSVAFGSSQFTSLYDFMDINDDLTLSMVKE
jgi:hypothetical protein